MQQEMLLSKAVQPHTGGTSSAITSMVTGLETRTLRLHSRLPELESALGQLPGSCGY